MAVSRAAKTAQRQELEQALRAAESLILVDFKGLNVPEATELRRQVKAARGRYRVVKNTLARQVLRGSPFESLSAFFQGPTALAYTGEDPVALAKTLAAFSKSTPALRIKAGVVQGRALQAAEVAELASLPGKAELYAKLLALFQAPLVQLVGVLSAAPRNLVNVLAQYEKKRTE